MQTLFRPPRLAAKRLFRWTAGFTFRAAIFWASVTAWINSLRLGIQREATGEKQRAHEAADGLDAMIRHFYLIGWKHHPIWDGYYRGLLGKTCRNRSPGGNSVRLDGRAPSFYFASAL